MKQQSGFTLIELIVVIVILGILAATALPKFSNLSVDARVAKMQGVAAALKGATAMAHGAALAEQLNAGSPVMLEGGQQIDMLNFYPSVDAASGIAFAIDGSGIQSSVAGGVYSFFSDTGRPGCVVTYTPAAAQGQVPVINDSAVSAVGTNGPCA